MSVLIKGMKMTKDCRDCLMTEYLPVTGNTWCKPADRCLAKNYKPIQFDGRPDWCPMVELQSAQPVDEDINVPCKDAISRQAAIDALGEEPPVWYEGEDEVAERNQWRRDVEAIKTLPSAQPEIVRCKDCKWWDKKDDSPYGYCMAMKHGFMSSHWEIGIYRTYKGDFYCADAERRTDDKST